MVVTSRGLAQQKRHRSHVRIETGATSLPIEVTVTCKLPPGAGAFLVEHALNAQSKHPEFVDEYNEPSAIIGKTNFAKADPTAVYTFGVDKRDLVFHRHAGHRVITGITGGSGCLLKFSLCSQSEANENARNFLDNLYIVKIPGDRVFVLRFSGSVYHQFCPAVKSENGFFAISTHTNEAAGLEGDLLSTVLANNGNIPLLTEPAPTAAIELLDRGQAQNEAIEITLDID